MTLFLSTTAAQRDTLRRALLAAVATHRPGVLCHLVDGHGPAAIAAALAPGSARVAADALSMLPADTRAAVAQHLPRAPVILSSRSGTVRRCADH